MRDDMTAMLHLCVAGDGVFASVQGNVISLVDLKSNSTQELVSLMDLRDVRNMSPGHLESFLTKCASGTRKHPCVGWLEVVIRHEISTRED